MAQAGFTVPERAAINALSSISTQHASSTQTHFPPNIDMTITRSPSPSQPRASWRNATHQNQMPRPAMPIEDLSSRDSSQTRNYTYTPFDDLKTRDGLMSTSEHRYLDESNLEVLRSDDAPPAQRETSSTPPGEPDQKITPATTVASESENGEPSNHLAPNSPFSNEKSNEERLPSNSSMVADSNIKIDSWQSKYISSEFLFDDENDMDDEDCDSDSEEESSEERWIPTDEDFEASVLRATESDLVLAARLVPHLYEIFREEESSVVGFWETCYYKRAGNFSGGNPTTGGEFSFSGSPRGQDTRPLKRQREDENGNGGEEPNDKEGGGGGQQGNTKSDGAGGSYAKPLACPFNKRYPEKYTGSFFRSPNGRKGEYRTCDSGFDNDQRFREHLQRHHRFVQCENCSQLFTGPQWKKRQINFQTHRIVECPKSPPDIHEGITELQWSVIDNLPRQRRSTDADSKPQFSSAKWKYIWRVLFPAVEAPQPWFTQSTSAAQKPTTLDQEKLEFQKCYEKVISDYSQGRLSPRDAAVRAFEAWSVKRRMEQTSLQQTEKGMSQMTLEENPEVEPNHSPRNQSQATQLMSFPNATPIQGRAEMSRLSSHQQPLQHSPSIAEFQSPAFSARRNATDPAPRYGMYTEIAMNSKGFQPSRTDGGQNSEQLSAQESMFHEESFHPKIIYADNGEPPNTFLKSQFTTTGDQFASSMGFGPSGRPNNHSASHLQYNSPTSFDTREIAQIQQSHHASLSSIPQYIANNAYQDQSRGFQHLQNYYATATGPPQQQLSVSQSIQPQERSLAFPKPHPDRNFGGGSHSFHDPYPEQDPYARD